MATLTTYTSYDEVRAALGVAPKELEDTTLALPLYVDYLLGELDDVNAGIVDEFTTVAAIAEISRTAAQQRFYLAVRLFATYSTAKQLTGSLSMFGPKDIGDGKALVSRFADSPYRQVIASVQKEYERLRSRLEAAYAALASTSVSVGTRTYLSVVSPSSDPVTGT